MVTTMVTHSFPIRYFLINRDHPYATVTTMVTHSFPRMPVIALMDNPITLEHTRVSLALFSNRDKYDEVSMKGNYL